MQEFIIISIVLLILFRTIRRFIFFNTQDAFKKAADDFYKRQEVTQRRNNAEGTVVVEKRTDKTKQEGEFVPYEEIK